MKNKPVLTILLTVFIFVSFVGKTFACAPGSPVSVYESEEILRDYYPLSERIDSKTPKDFPILNQDYEIITPGWGPEYLLPVFLSAEKINLPEEIKNLLFFYYLRTVTYKVSRTLLNKGVKDLAEEFDYLNKWNEFEKIEALANRWMSIRNTFIKEPYSGDKYYPVEYNLGLCADQALNRAADDFEFRKSKYSDAEIENWVRAQDKVFQNCLSEKTAVTDKISKSQSWWDKVKLYFKNRNKKVVQIDNVSSSDLFRYDQEYQEAADSYYSKNYPLAVKLFREIADDKGHPHNQLAQLSLGWTFIGWDTAKYEADLKEEKSEAEENYIKNLKETQKYYEKMYASQSDPVVKNEYRKYLDFVIFRSDPALRLIEAEKTLLNPGDAKEFSRQLEDFKQLWYKYFHRFFFYQKDEPRHEEIRGKITKSQSPFLHFILEWEKPTAENVQSSLDNYRKNNNPLWLILALRQSGTERKDFQYIRGEINKITAESPFYLTAQYYLAELLSKDSENKDEAKKITEKFIKETFVDNRLAAFNLFSDIRENLASDPQEAFKFSIRYPLATYDENWDSIPFIPYYSYDPKSRDNSKKNPLLSGKTKIYLSSIPPKELSEFIVDNTAVLDESLARYLKLTAFYRLLVLDDLGWADRIAKNISATDSVFASVFKRYLSATDSDAKKFMAASILIDYPRIYPQIGNHFDDLAHADLNFLTEINEYRKNWSSEYACMNEKYRPDDYIESDIDKKVNSNLKNFLAETLLEYMTKNPNNLDPKLLHQIVDFCHLSACQNEETSDLARQAFQLLHTRYPGNYWAKQTPYWY